MRRLARVLVLVALVVGPCALALRAADAQTVVVPLEPPSRITLARVRFSRGSDVQAIDAAVAQCRREADGQGQYACMPDAFGVEHPRREVLISAFAIDRTEVTHAAYARCIAAGVCPPPHGVPMDARFTAPDVPIVGVGWADARRYCAHVGGRLPTEAEWERAARGAPGRFYPWGDVWNPRVANHGRAIDRVDGDDGFEHLAPVGSLPSGATPEGLVDMAGNAAEWVEDAFVMDAYEHTSRVDPVATGPSGVRVVRGGSFLAMPHQLRSSARRGEAEGDVFPDVGFRCAYDVRTADASDAGPRSGT